MFQDRFEVPYTNFIDTLSWLVLSIKYYTLYTISDQGQAY